MARVTQRELLIEAMKALYGLAGIGTGRVTELFKDGASNEQLLDCIQLAEKEARAQWMKRHEQAHKALGVLLQSVDLTEPCMSLDCKNELLPEAIKRLQRRRDAMHELASKVGAIADDAWLADNATAGDPPDHQRLAALRRRTLRRIEHEAKPLVALVDSILFGFEDEE